MKKIITFLVVTLPTIAFAQKLSAINNINDIRRSFLSIVDLAIYLLISFAVLYIVYYVVRYLVMGSDPKEKSAAGMNILWGIGGLAIIVSIWGVVNIFTNTFNTTNTIPKIPSADFVNKP